MTNEIQSTEQTELVGTADLIMNPGSLQALEQFATAMAKAKVTVPKHLANSPGDCLAIVMQAAQWRMNPFAVAQKTHLVNGTLGYEAQLVNAVVCASGVIEGRFHYEYQGEGANVSCRVGAIPRGESEVVWGEWLSAASVTTKNSPLWKTNPKQQMGYLQVKNWARQYAPGAILGVYTPDELATISAEREVSGEVVSSRPRPTEPDDLPEYPPEQFAANLPKWRDAIESGKRSAEQIIAMVETKGRLSDEQKAAICVENDEPERDEWLGQYDNAGGEQ